MDGEARRRFEAHSSSMIDFKTLKMAAMAALRSGGRLLALVAAVLLLVPAQTLQADIRSTKHNLAERYGLERSTVNEREVCVFCHFPAIVDEAGNLVSRTASAAPPLWQQSVATDFSYPIYDDIGRIGLDGSMPVGSQSMACLACHDSNQAFVVAGGPADHPFGVPYRGIRASQGERDAALDIVKRAGTPLREGSYLFDRMNTDYRPAYESVVENRRIFWVSAAGNTLRRAKTDLPLYSRARIGVSDDIPFIECTSCHDPHSSNDLFLRVSNQQNQLCLTCHAK